MPDIDMKEINKSFEGLNKGFEEFKTLNDERLKVLEEKGTVDPLLDEKLERINADMTKSQTSLYALELALKRKERVATDEKGNEIDLDEKANKWAARAAKETGKLEEAKSFDAEGLTAYSDAFYRLARKNFNMDFMTDMDRKALSVGSDSSGGYFVTPDMSGRIVQQVYETSAVRAYASVQVISSDSLEGFYDNDEVGYGWVGELEARPETTTPAVGKWSIPVHEMYAMPKASQKLLDDAELNVESWLAGKIADKFSRAENTAFVTGTGIAQPRGWLDYANGTDLTNSVEQHKTGANGAFAAAPDGGDVLITALYDLKAQYRANAAWFMNTGTAAAVRKLKDSNGAYVWAPSLAAGQPSTILGYSLAVFEDMPDMATGALAITVGDLRAAYQVVDRTGIRMLRDPFSSKPNVLFYATKRTGGDMINGEAIKNIDFSV